MKDSGTPFHARVTKWSKDKEAEVRKKTLLMEHYQYYYMQVYPYKIVFQLTNNKIRRRL